MAIDSKHPYYEAMLPDWVLMMDSYKGEREVKRRAEVYLPATSGMIADGMSRSEAGWQAYQAYRTRAIYHDYVSDAVKTMVGLLHSKPALFELPSALEYLVEKASIDNESLTAVLRQINANQLTTGRIGLLLDINESKNPFYISLYSATSIINWDTSKSGESDLTNLTYVILEENTYDLNDDYTWTSVQKHRLLWLDNGVYTQNLYKGNTLESKVVPLHMGKSLDKIPFIFVNSNDNVALPDDPPLIGLARLVLAIYRGEADYRQNLFMQGQDTLVLSGNFRDEEGSSVRVGAGATLKIPCDADAKYIGVNSNGLQEQREALTADKALAQEKSGRLLSQFNQKESGVALHMRLAAQTATLKKIAAAGAAGLENILKLACEWSGQDPEKIEVNPNYDFVQEPFDSKEALDLISAKNLGYPISAETLFNFLKERGFVLGSFEEEVDKIETEGGQLGPFKDEEDEDDKEDNKEDTKKDTQASARK